MLKIYAQENVDTQKKFFLNFFLPGVQYQIEQQSPNEDAPVRIRGGS
jgi:hypothetical protein